jgi:hypothetical protein
MVATWTEQLRINPLRNLIGTDDKALLFFIERDLMDGDRGNVEDLWELPAARKILASQKPDGSWFYKGNRPGDDFGEAYELLETWKTLRKLVEMYGFNRSHPVLSRAAEYIFSFQTQEGDIRGILSNQYMPYYMGAILEVLIKAGYENDKRVEKGIEWLLDMRQEDGGWIAPLLLYKMSDYYKICMQPPVQPLRHLPFSHTISGMVIRAFAAHSHFKKSPEAKRAGFLLKGRFFQKDAYTSRQAESYWVKFQFPFWWSDLLTVLDSLMRMEFSPKDEDIQKGLDWLIDNQCENGLWHASYGKTGENIPDYWITFAVCRVLRYFIK